MNLPIIGITVDQSFYTDSRGIQTSRLELGEYYSEAVLCAGGLPLIIPQIQEEHAAQYLKLVDALVVSGGDFDVPPELFGQTPHEKLGRLQPKRTTSEMALLKEAQRTNLPTLGVCGGMQLMNVMRGGTLHQDQSLYPNVLEHLQAHDKRKAHHILSIEKNSRLHRLVQQEDLPANSTHHQLIDQLGDGLVASAHAPDGVIEALEDPQKAFWLGVQWHPEAMAVDEQRAIYQGLVDATQKS